VLELALRFSGVPLGLPRLELSVGECMIFASVVLCGVAAFLLVRVLFPAPLVEEVSEKAARMREASAAQAAAADGRPAATPGRLKAFGGAFVERLGNYNERLVKPDWQKKMKARFTALGRPELRPQDFIAHQQIWTVLFGLFGLLLLNSLNSQLWYAIAFAAFGFVFPYIWLSDQIKKRQRAILRALPYNIDLLTLSVEAGLDFQAALGTVVEKGRPGPLVEELNLTLSEIKLGKTRAEALRNLADRVQIPEIAAFVSNLIQADRMGTSMGKVLRIQSTQLRINRTHRAEKLANEAPVKMLLPLIGCIFPTVFLVLFGPTVYRILHGGL
jgi:tight adherence protein C